jgi:peptide/nickel transport system substrate-binding protein
MLPEPQRRNRGSTTQRRVALTDASDTQPACRREQYVPGRSPGIVLPWRVDHPLRTQCQKSFNHNEAVEAFSPIPAKPRTEFFDAALKNPYPFNLRRGRTLMEQHGWHLDHGVLTKDGHRFTFTLMYGNGSIAANSSLQLLAYDWGQEGFDVHLEPENASSAFGVMVGPKQSAWQMAYFPEGYWTYEPDYYPTGGGLFLPQAGGNYSHYENATMNQLIAATYRPATTLAQSQARMFQYEAWAARDLPVLYMPYYPALLVHSDSVHGVVRTENPVSILYSANDWWVS